MEEPIFFSVVIARHQGEFGQECAVRLQAAVLHTAVYAVARSDLIDLRHAAQQLAFTTSTGGRVSRQIKSRHSEREGYRGEAEPVGASLQDQRLAVDFAKGNRHRRGGGEQVGEVAGVVVQPYGEVGHGGVQGQGKALHGGTSVGHHGQEVIARVEGDRFRRQFARVAVGQAEERAAVGMAQVESHVLRRYAFCRVFQADEQGAFSLGHVIVIPAAASREQQERQERCQDDTGEIKR